MLMHMSICKLPRGTRHTDAKVTKAVKRLRRSLLRVLPAALKCSPRRRIPPKSIESSCSLSSLCAALASQATHFEAAPSGLFDLGVGSAARAEAASLRYCEWLPACISQVVSSQCVKPQSGATRAELALSDCKWHTGLRSRPRRSS